MRGRWFALLRLHLLDRSRRLSRGLVRGIIAGIALTGWAAVMYGITAFTASQPGQAGDAAYMAAHAMIFICLVAGAMAAIDGVRPGGRWMRLAFFPLHRAQIAALVLSENVILTLLAAALWMAPGVAALLQYHVLGPAALGMCAVVAIVFSVAIVAWTMLLGLVASRFVGIPWLHRYSQEIVATGGVILNWLALVGITDMGAFRHVAPFMQQLPAPWAARILEWYFSGEALPIEGLVMHMAWAAVPCAVLFIIPLRRPPLVARAKKTGPVRTRRRSTVIACEPVSLGRETFLRFHVQFIREPSFGRSAVFVSITAIALAWLFAFVADYAPLQPEIAMNPFMNRYMAELWWAPVRILIAGLFTVAAMLASLVLPLEKGHVVFVRLSSRPLRALLVHGQLTALAYPLLLWLLGAVFVWIRSGQRDVLVPYMAFGLAAVALGNGIGMLMGTLFGRYDWKHVVGANELPARLVTGAAVLGVYRLSGPAISWSLAPATAGADAVRVGAIVVGAITLAMLFAAGSVQFFKKRPPDELALRTAAE